MNLAGAAHPDPDGAAAPERTSGAPYDASPQRVRPVRGGVREPGARPAVRREEGSARYIHQMSRLLVFAVLLGPGFAGAATAPAVTCHCFRNRSFDPADPPAADPYILATARSSLLSAVFGVSKATLVRAAMSGTTPEDLWIAHWTAVRTGHDAASLMSAVAEARSWHAALAGSKGLPPAFEAALARGAQPSALAALAVDDVVASRLGADGVTLRALRDAGATSEELVVSVFLAGRLKAPATVVLARFRDGHTTWGTLLAEAGLGPEGIEAAMRSAVR